MNLIKRTALITGASRGLGLELARALAASGWQLLINARGAEALASAATELSQQTTVRALAGDIADAAHRAELAQAAAEFGRLDLVINNAGILGPSPQPALLDYPLDTLINVVNIDAVAQLGILQAVAPVLGDGAAIINITSDAAVEAYPGWGGYGAAKAMFEQLSAVFAAENPQWRTYWVDPGDMRTAMHQAAFPGEDIGDRPLPSASVPGLMALIDSSLSSEPLPSGRYRAADVVAEPQL